MSKTTAYLLGMLLTIILGTYLFLNYCSECQADNASTTEEVIEPAAIAEPTAYPFSLKDDDYAFEVDDNFNFQINTDNFNTPVSTNVDTGIESVQTYLAEHPNKLITITGLYKSDETNTTAFPNLGLARANRVKNYLVSKGISSKQTATAGLLNDGMVADGETFLGPVNFKIDELLVDTDALKVLHDEIVANPLILYFKTGEAEIQLSASQRQKVANIANYLDKVDDARCRIIGHSDNTGNAENNKTLALDRAMFAKNYLVNNGITENKIEVSSKGQEQPIASNDTEEGRAKNRRVEVTLN